MADSASSDRGIERVSNFADSAFFGRGPQGVPKRQTLFSGGVTFWGFPILGSSVRVTWDYRFYGFRIFGKADAGPSSGQQRD